MGHRTRELLSGQRTAAINALRGHLAEIGVVAAQGAHNAYGLQIDALDDAIGAIDEELAAPVKADETARRLMTIPGSRDSLLNPQTVTRSRRPFASSAG